MSQQQPPAGWGQPSQQSPIGYAPPPPPKKTSAGKIIGIIAAGIVGFFVLVGGCAAVLSGSDAGDDMQKTDPPAAAADEAKDAGDEVAEDKPADKPRTTQAETFKGCVAKNGTPTEKDAVDHVTKVTGADGTNGILDAPEVWTDYSGDMFGPHQSDAKLIATAFASCYESENGLVTVYGKSGELLANGNF